MQSKALLSPALVTLALALSGCGSNSSDDTATETATETTSEPSANAPSSGEEADRAVKVEIAEFAYDPNPVTVQVGGKVIWQNQDSVPHTATAEDGSFDTGPIAQGKLKSETFKQPGSFPYVCEIHPSMHGTIEVVEKD